METTVTLSRAFDDHHAIQFNVLGVWLKAQGVKPRTCASLNMSATAMRRSQELGFLSWWSLVVLTASSQ